MKSKISATIIADSINPQGDRITTYELVFPRFILAELNTHRVFSKNSASSRAIPFKKMKEMVINDPFIPIAWQKDHKGMQGTEYFNTHYSQTNDYNQDIHYGFWMDARDEAIMMATCLHDEELTKQLCNRLLEPFMWHKVLLTATEFNNFFNLRCPRYLQQGKFYKSKKDALKNPPRIKEGLPVTELNWLQVNIGQAEIHMQALAECMYDAINESTPEQLEPGEYHIPYGDNVNYEQLGFDTAQYYKDNPNEVVDIDKWVLKVATARCARLSYQTVGDNPEIDYEADIRLHDRLLEDNHCFDSLTEILTSTGWKKFTAITEEDLIAQINVQNGNFCGFSKPIEIIKKEYKGKVYKYNAKNIDLFITEGHKLLGVPINISSDRIKSYESLEIFEANKQRVKATPQANLKYKTYGEQEIKMFSAPKPKKINSSNIEYLKGCLAGFFIGDGHKSSTNKIIFRLKKERKINFLKHILTILKIQYKSSIKNNKVHEIKLTDNGMFSIFYNANNKKTIPQINVENEEFIYGLFEGLKQSDGSIKRNTWVYDTSSKDLHDRILDLCPLVGLTGYSNPSCPLQKLSENQNTHYRIAFTTNNHILVNDTRTTNSRVQIEDYNGMVYCVRVPKHGIIVRRNGKTIITHNCSPFEHCAKAMSHEEYFLFRKGKGEADYGLGISSSNPVVTHDKKDYGWCDNMKGFISYRYLLENNLKL